MISIFLDTFEKLISKDVFNLKEILKYISTKTCKIFELEWCVFYVIPVKETYKIEKVLVVSKNDLYKIFNIKKKLFKNTLLYELYNKNLKKKFIKEKFHYPEYKNKFNLFSYKFDSTNFNLLVEFSVKKKDKFKEELLLKFMNLIIRILNERYEDEEKNKKINDLANLIEISKILNSTLHLDTLLNRLFTEVRNIMHTEGCSLMLKSKKTGELKFKTVKGKRSNIIKEFSIPAGKGIAGWIVRNKKSVLVNDVSKDKRFYSGMDHRSGFMTRNIVGAPLLIKDNVIGIIEAVNKLNKENFNFSDKEILGSLANLAAIAIQNATLYHELQEFFLNTVKSLSAAIDAKDPYTKGHSERVTKYSIMLVKKLKLDEQIIKEIEWSAILHDIGKIGIDEVILSKPGKLSQKEYNIIKKHPSIGESIMKPIKELEDILPGIRNHHERWDGRGYPDRLTKGNIPLLARIIALSDTFDAMTSDRPYRKKAKPKLALKEIAACAGTQFDPFLAKIFVKTIKKIKKF